MERVVIRVRVFPSSLRPFDTEVIGWSLEMMSPNVREIDNGMNSVDLKSLVQRM